MSRSLVFLVFVFVRSGRSGAEVSTWPSTSGKTTEAEFVSYSNETKSCVLRRADGKEATVPVKSLSKADRDYIANLNNLRDFGERFYDLPPGTMVEAEILRVRDDRLEKFKLPIYLKSPEQSRQDEKDACPIIVREANLSRSVIGTAEISVRVQNNVDRRIVGYKLKGRAYNSFGEPVRGIESDNEFRGISQLPIEPGTENTSKWPLVFRDTTTDLRVQISG